MKCPHCSKNIVMAKRSRYLQQVLKLYRKGRSCRDISSDLNGKVSFVTISRWVLASKRAKIR